jgi:uncharacterized DUF497 family protein
MIEFEWDPEKARKNIKKHRVAFEEAATVFQGIWTITSYDPDHSEDEDRLITVGFSSSGRPLIVAHTDRAERVRIINARELTRAELEAYEEEIKRRKG